MLKVTYKKLTDLTGYKRNSRIHSEQQIQQIVDSITEFGFTNPLLIQENGTIIAGHGRFEAAKILKFEEVPTIVISGLSEAQVKALVIADNKIAQNAGWDYELLKIELGDLNEDGFKMELTGFPEIELDNLLADFNEPEASAEEEWADMPEFKQDDKTSHRKIIVHFENDDDVADFFALIKQPHTDKTKSIWHPVQVNMDTEAKRYDDEEQE